MTSEAPLAGPGPLVDVHAHFHWEGSARSDWRKPNEARLRAGERIGITVHIASILGSWGLTSPIYLSSPHDISAGNDAMLELQRAWPRRIRSYATVNPNDSVYAAEEIERCIEQGAVGIKIAASRRADDPLLDPVAEKAESHGLPILHHIWQYRRRDWPGQDASDAVEYGRLAARHPRVSFILAHLGGGGDWGHTLAAVEDLPNVYVDLSGSGVDRGMLDAALIAVGAERMLWGCDVTMETGLAKWRALEVIAPGAPALESVRWRNAARIFPRDSLPGVPNATANA
jgi:predicted TIM-barrel fold metal-dependent hydrolase